MSVGRLSEHVLLGGLQYPFSRGAFIAFDADRKPCAACYVGSAILSVIDGRNVYPQGCEEIALNLWPWLRNEAECPVCRARTEGFRIIAYHLGCGSCMWSRPAVAAWIRTVEPVPADERQPATAPALDDERLRSGGIATETTTEGRP